MVHSILTSSSSIDLSQDCYLPLASSGLVSSAAAALQSPPGKTGYLLMGQLALKLSFVNCL